MPVVLKPVAELAAELPQVEVTQHGTKISRPGTRVAVTVRDVTATGTVAEYFAWQSVAVTLDGTGETIVIPAPYLKGI